MFSALARSGLAITSITEVFETIDPTTGE